MKIIVSQYGSRRRYKVPQILEGKNMLEALYTDSTKYSLLGKLSTFFVRVLKAKQPLINRLSKRNPIISRNKIHTSDALFINGALNRLIGKTDTYSVIHNIFSGLSSIMIKWGVKNANVLYTMYIENLDFVKFAKNKGLKIIIDVYEHPQTYRQIKDENDKLEQRFPKLNSANQYEIYQQYRDDRLTDMINLGDVFLAPSDWVKEGLKDYMKAIGVSKKIKVIPYGSSISYKKSNNPIKGRILWVGTDYIRKGLFPVQHAVMALIKEYPFLEVRVAGIDTTFPYINSELFANFTFLGHISKEAIIKEYLSADMFVFPTITEGFAGVVIEAASAGCPVITTKSSGVNVTDFPGIILENNEQDLIDKIKFILDNREDRDKMSIKLKQYSNRFTEKEWSKRLLTALHEC